MRHKEIPAPISYQNKKAEVLVSTNFGLPFNGCGHFLLYPFHLTDTPSNCILPLIIIINKSMTKFLNQMLS